MPEFPYWWVAVLVGGIGFVGRWFFRTYLPARDKTQKRKWELEQTRITEEIRFDHEMEEREYQQQVKFNDTLTRTFIRFTDDTNQSISELKKTLVPILRVVSNIETHTKLVNRDWSKIEEILEDIYIDLEILKERDKK